MQNRISFLLMLFSLKRLCCVFLWLLLLLPALQAKFQWVEEPALDGAYTLAPRVQFSFPALLANNYQPALEHYVEDRIGFHNYLIRLRNQLATSVFNESWANRLAIGRHHVLFEQEYIDSYLGTDFVGDERVELNVRRFRNVQDSLALHHVQLVFAIGPSKASFMPENLPLAASRRARTRSNYEAYSQALTAAGVHVLDFSRALQHWKRYTPYPLFAAGGTHWTMYGGARAADSLQSYLRDSLQVRTAPFKLADIEFSTTPRDTDDDLAKTMNLLVRPASEELAYPKLKFEEVAGHPKPNLLLIADSFGWTWVYNSFLGNAFSDQSRYWYYNSEVAYPGPELTPEGRDIAQLKTLDNYLARKVIVVMFNERNLVEFDKGFSRELFNMFHPYKKADYERYAELTKEIQRKATWEEGASEDFERRTGETVNSIIERERIESIPKK
jgi:hypothetical protein